VGSNLASVKCSMAVARGHSVSGSSVGGRHVYIQAVHKLGVQPAQSCDAGTVTGYVAEKGCLCHVGLQRTA
jgi:hypothetical protein